MKERCVYFEWRLYSKEFEGVGDLDCFFLFYFDIVLEILDGWKVYKYEVVVVS